MNKIFITILLTLLFLPIGINASEVKILDPKTYSNYRSEVSTPVTQSVIPTKVQPITLPPATQQVACPERIIEKTIIKETKEVVVLPKGMTLIKNSSELKKLKKGSKTWKDSNGKLYLLK